MTMQPDYDLDVDFILTTLVARMRNLERALWRMHQLTRDCLPPDTQREVDGMLDRLMHATERMEGPEGIGLEFETVVRPD